MAFPKILKDFNLFGEGESWITQIEEVTLPKIARKVEEYVAGGMAMPVDIDMGLEKMEMDWTSAGWFDGLFDGLATTSMNGNMLRFVGSAEDDSTGAVIPVEITVRGRHREVDMGNAKKGDKNQIKITTSLAYYKLTLNGQEKIEIDAAGYIFKVNGKDVYAERRKALGI